MENTKYIVIDAGHGGKDPGAIGVNKTKESVIVLSIAKKIKPILERCGLKVIMTRTTEDFIGINERVVIEKKTKNYCFVSIHCNAFNGSASGLEVLYNTPSTNGKKLAQTLYDQLIADGLYNKKRGIKPRNDLGVLKNTVCPASLVETAFIDNISDYNLLQNKQDAFANSIAKGICKYVGVNFVSNTQTTTPSNNATSNKGESKLLKTMRNKVVRSGSKGAHVYALQGLLTSLGYNVNGIDGHCGPGCVAAIKSYQRDNGLSVDGSFGPASWEKLLTAK